MLEAERILRTLARHQVRFVVIGALGATFHGSPLRTEDIDICPDSQPQNLDRLAAALRELDAKEWDFRKDVAISRLFDAQMLALDDIWILLTDAGRLDLVFKPGAFDGYDELLPQALEFDLDGVRVKVAALEDIIRSKEAAGREKDLAQLPTLRRLLDLKD